MEKFLKISRKTTKIWSKTTKLMKFHQHWSDSDWKMIITWSKMTKVLSKIQPKDDENAIKDWLDVQMTDHKLPVYKKWIKKVVKIWQSNDKRFD